jgi:hypothetical protein
MATHSPPTQGFFCSTRLQVSAALHPTPFHAFGWMMTHWWHPCYGGLCQRRAQRIRFAHKSSSPITRFASLSHDSHRVPNRLSHSLYDQHIAEPFISSLGHSKASASACSMDALPILHCDLTNTTRGPFPTAVPRAVGELLSECASVRHRALATSPDDSTAL